MSLKDFSQNNVFTVYVISLILTFFTVTHIGSAIMTGLDPSYQFAYNYFFTHNVQIGKDVLFTYGPLGFLYSPAPIGDNLYIATAVVLISKFIFIFTSIKLYKEVRGDISLYNWIIITLLIYAVTSKIGLHHLFMFTPLLLILRHSINKNLFLIFLASVITAIALLTKSSSGIVSLLILISYVLYTLYQNEYKVFVASLVTTSVTFMIIWFNLYHDFLGVYDYFYAILEFSRGNSSAMTLNPDNNWWIFTLFVLLYMSYPFVQREKSVLLHYGITLLAAAAMFKFAMSRQDHIGVFESYLFDLLFISFLVTKNFNYKAFIHLLFAYLAFIAFMMQTPWKHTVKDRLIRTHIPNKPLEYISALDVANEYKVLKHQSNKNLERRKLNDEMMDIIGHSTIDAYPSYNTYFAANQLNWKTKPLIQAYVAYTPYLDHKNATFFDSEDAPEFLLWHWDGNMKGVSQRYLLNENPAGLYQIFNHYSMTYKTEWLRLLKRTDEKRLTATPIGEQTYRWNEWIDVPQIQEKYNSTFILAKMDIERSIFQKIKKLIYKEFDVFIEYKLYDQTTIKHRLVVDLVENGVWVNPMLDGLFTYPITGQVVAIRLTHDKHDYFEKDIMIRWEKIEGNQKLFEVRRSKQVNITQKSFSSNIKQYLEEYRNTENYFKIIGWAFIENAKIDSTKKYIVCKGSKHNFIFDTYRQRRKDVTLHFKAKNLNSSGYQAYIPKSELPSDTYTFNLLLIDADGSQYKVSLDQKVVIK